MARENKNQENKSAIPQGRDTAVIIKLPAKVSVALVQANAIKPYEDLQRFAGVALTTAGGFWTAFFTTGRPMGLAVSAALFTVFAVTLFLRARSYGKDVYLDQGEVEIGATLKGKINQK